MTTDITRVRIDTTLGAIELELDAAKAPKTVANFVQYANDGHYDGLVFHRVIKGFMIQGGGYDASYDQRKTRAPIAIESANGLKNDHGTIAMARTSDPTSATRSEEHTSELQPLMRISYAVFCLKNKKTKKYTRDSTQTTHN